MTGLKKIKSVYASKKYLYLSVFISLATFIALYYLTFYYTTPKALRTMEGAFYLYFTLISDFIISILFGFNVSLLLHQLKANSKIAKESSLAGSGVLAGAFASGCPFCGSLLLPLVGISSGLVAFPFRGMELKAVAVSLMLVSTYFMLKDSNKCDSCRNVKVKNEAQKQS